MTVLYRSSPSDRGDQLFLSVIDPPEIIDIPLSSGKLSLSDLRWASPPLVYIFMRTVPPCEIKIGQTGGDTAVRIVEQKRCFSHHDRLLLIGSRGVQFGRGVRWALERSLQVRAVRHMPWCFLRAKHIISHASAGLSEAALQHATDIIGTALDNYFTDDVKQTSGRLLDLDPSWGLFSIVDYRGRPFAQGMNTGSELVFFQHSRIVPHAAGLRALSKSCTPTAGQSIVSLYRNGYLARTVGSTLWGYGLEVHRPFAVSCPQEAIWLFSGGYDVGNSYRDSSTQSPCALAGQDIWALERGLGPAG